MTQPIGVNFDQAVRDAVMGILSDPLAFPEVFKSWITGWVEANPPTLPIGQITGYTKTVPQIASAVRTTESTDLSGSYKDLATVGPTLSNVADGTYLLIYSCLVTNKDAGGVAYMAPSVNGATPSDSEAAGLGAGVSAPGTGIWWDTFTLKNNGSSTIKLQYRNGGGGGASAFANRLLVALRVSS